MKFLIEELSHGVLNVTSNWRYSHEIALSRIWSIRLWILQTSPVIKIQDTWVWRLSVLLVNKYLKYPELSAGATLRKVLIYTVFNVEKITFLLQHLHLWKQPCTLRDRDDLKFVSIESRTVGVIHRTSLRGTPWYLHYCDLSCNSQISLPYYLSIYSNALWDDG